MLKLTKHSIIDIKSYYTKLTNIGMVDTLYTEVSKSKLSVGVKIFLTKLKIEEILEAEPKRLNEIHEEFIKSMNKNYTTQEYVNYLEAKSKKKLNKAEKDLIRKYYPTGKKLSKIFDYERYISNKKSKSYPLSQLIGKNTCTYCNRLYTFTILKKDVNTNKIIDSKSITRPQFDHWFPKKKYPLFALSFYNLIPSCSVCNSSVKNNTVFSLSTHVHPYIDEFDQKFKFSYTLKPDGSNEIVLKCHGDKVKKTMEDMKIKEIYDEHVEFELKDILDLRFKYSDNYLDVLFNDTFNLNEVKKKDVYRMLYGVEIDSNDFHKRPFSKFKYDILKELGIIK